MRSAFLCLVLTICAANALLTVPYAVVAASGGSGTFTGAPGAGFTTISFSNFDSAGAASVSATSFGPSSGSVTKQFAKIDIQGTVTSNCPGISQFGIGTNGIVNLYRTDLGSSALLLASVGTVSNQAFTNELGYNMQSSIIVPYVIPNTASFAFRIASQAGSQGGSTSCTTSVSNLSYTYSVIGAK